MTSTQFSVIAVYITDGVKKIAGKIFSEFTDPEECVRIIMRNYWSGRKKKSYMKSCKEEASSNILT